MPNAQSTTSKPLVRDNALIFATSSSYLTGFLTTFASALAASHLESFNIYIGHDSNDPLETTWQGIIQLCKRFNFPIERCHRISIDYTCFNACEPLADGSYHTYGRHYMTTILEEHTCLYLDSDILVLDDLLKLAQEFPKDAAIAAIQDRYLLTHANDHYHLNGTNHTSTAPYFNSGVLLSKPHKLRELHLVQQFQTLQSRLSTPSFNDQTCINIIFENNWTQLPARWNALTIPRHPTPLTANDELMGIIHFVTNEKPWLQATLDAPNILWHCIAQNSGIAIPPEVDTALDALIDQRLALNHRRLRLKSHYYSLRKSKKHKAIRAQRILNLHNELTTIENWLIAHQLGPLPDKFQKLRQIK